MAVLVVLVAAAPAWGHAILVNSSPTNGTVLASPPREVTFTFSTSVRAGSRNAAIRNDGTDVTRGKAAIRNSRTLVIPLQPNLADGTYTVRWNIVSNDGHQEEGVIAFGLGEGSGPPLPALSARGFVTWQQVVMRTAFLLGVLAAAGAAFFSVAVVRPLGASSELLRRQSHLLFAAFLLAFVGADALINATTGSATRFEQILWVAAATSVVGAAAAALAPLYPPLRYAAWGAAGVLALCPTLAGHALDPDQPTVIAPLADVLHLGGAAVWLGGLASLVFVVSRAPEGLRRDAARRFSAVAAPAVLVIAAGGGARALTELAGVSQLWTTSYGRTLLVKTALFGALVAVGWRSRAALAARFARLRQLVLVELVLLLVVVVAVGALTAMRPGRSQTQAAPAPTAPAVAQPPPPPPVGAYVDAGQAGPLAVGFAYDGGNAIVTLVDGRGNGVTDVSVEIDGGPTRACGRGCFSQRAADRSVEVRVGGTTLEFDVPADLRRATAELRRVTRVFESLPAVVIQERLSSGPGNLQVTRFRVQAPDRMAYRIVSASNPILVGTEGIVIGARRWDRLPGGAWVASPQAPLRLPEPFWTEAARNAYFSGPSELTFYDATFPAWFRLRYAPATGRAIELRMIGKAHFMVHRYSGFDRRAAISPPSR